MYYNSTKLSGEDLKEAVSKATKQDEAILLIYENTGKAYGPNMILSLCNKAGHKWPITSIRRSITNLENDGKLTKTGTMVMGGYGKLENQWKII